MIVAIKTDFWGNLHEPLRSLISDFNDIKWRTESVPNYLYEHLELECAQPYHIPNRLFRTVNNTIMLVDVDISRPWTILDYDGAEYIQYLDFDVVDAESNYCELKKE